MNLLYNLLGLLGWWIGL